MTNIFFINNDGGGFADDLSVRDGTTMGELFSAQVGAEASFANYTIRVNRDVVPRDYVLQDGDRVTIVPNKIEGA